MEQLCPWESAQYIIFSSNIPPLLYYSHFAVILTSVIFAAVLIREIRHNPIVMWLYVVFSFFLIWTIVDLAIWATNDPQTVLFLWGIQIISEVLLFYAAVFLSYVFFTNKSPSVFITSVLTLLMVPIIVLIPTNVGFLGVDIATCNAIQTSLTTWYVYLYEILCLVPIVYIGVREYYKPGAKRKIVTSYTLGIILFLISFSSGNIIGGITDNWDLAQIGLVGMPIFTAFLVYITVKFQTFNVKIIGTQALVVVLFLITFLQIFVRTIQLNQIIIFVNLIFVAVVGYYLIKGVKREIQQREYIEKLVQDLETTNKRQVLLVHFITHQIKGFLAKSRNVFSMVLDGDFGPVGDDMRPILQEGFNSDMKGIDTVTEILNAANIKSGKITYNKEPFNIKDLVQEVLKVLTPNADKKGIALITAYEESDCIFEGDRFQIMNAIKNLIDNSIKYTQTGSVTITLKKQEGKIVLSVQDTGVGITPEDMQVLFTEGGRGKDSVKVNVESTGFGLFIVKNIIEAHLGTVSVTSEGAGKGSLFTVELPV